jgi:hypothetical protein
MDLADIRGRSVHAYTLRPDRRQFRLFLGGARLLVVSSWIGDDGHPRLEVDLVVPHAAEPHRPAEPASPHLEHRASRQRRETTGQG